IPLLAERFARAAGIEGHVEGPNLARLLGYAWPGNVRELRNSIERAVALAGGRCPFADLPLILSDESPTVAWPVDLGMPLQKVRERVLATTDRLYAKGMLERTAGNVSEAARRAGVSRRHFTELVRRHGLREDTEGEDD